LNFYSLAPPWLKKISNFVFCPICHGFWKQSIVVGLKQVRYLANILTRIDHGCKWSIKLFAFSYGVLSLSPVN
jgi:hypothetical protein